MIHADAAFTLDSWDQETWDDAEGATLARARVTKTFSGEVVGTSVAELLLATAGEGSAAYVGLERVVGSIQGRAGTFVLHHTATAAAGEQSGSWTVVPDSGTGELRGLRATPPFPSTRKAGISSPSTTSWTERPTAYTRGGLSHPDAVEVLGAPALERRSIAHSGALSRYRRPRGRC